MYFLRLSLPLFLHIIDPPSLAEGGGVNKIDPPTLAESGGQKKWAPHLQNCGAALNGTFKLFHPLFISVSHPPPPDYSENVTICKIGGNDMRLKTSFDLVQKVHFISFFVTLLRNHTEWEEESNS